MLHICTYVHAYVYSIVCLHAHSRGSSQCHPDSVHFEVLPPVHPGTEQGVLAAGLT